jgi:hypothetical protein
VEQDQALLCRINSAYDNLKGRMGEVKIFYSVPVLISGNK